MATINYKEKYEKAVHAAMLAKQDTESAVTIRILEEIFPELKESEDVKIEEEIIEYLKLFGKGKEDHFQPTVDRWIAWLEKQAEHANFRNKIQIGDRVTRNKDGVIVNLSQLNRVAKIDEKQGEQKPADKVKTKFKVGQTIKKEGFNLGFTIVKIEDGFYYNDMGDYFPFTAQDDWELVEQKPAWSEEDEEKMNWIIATLNNCSMRNSESLPMNESCEDWLKSLKDRVQPHQEWSEEDATHYNRILKELILQKEMPINASVIEEVKSDIIWFKSLRPQSQWKPSYKQMEALWSVTEKYLESDNENVRKLRGEVLESLYEDLKKLKEE